TRSKRDWSSDVCSSDLAPGQLSEGRQRREVWRQLAVRVRHHCRPPTEDRVTGEQDAVLLEQEAQRVHRVAGRGHVADAHATRVRSEERRVGEEYRFW